MSLNMRKYYENYWNRETDVSDGDITTPERKRRLLETLSRHVKAGEYVLDLGCGGVSLPLGCYRRVMLYRGWIYQVMH